MKQSESIASTQPPRTLVFLCEGGSEHWIVILPGAGQRITNYLSDKLGLEALEKNVLAGPKKRMNELKFNLIAVAPGKEYTRADIIDTLRYAHGQGARFVHVIDHSLGGFALANFMDAEIAALIDSAFWASSGPGAMTKAAVFIAKAGFANWIAVSSFDTGTAGDLAFQSKLLHDSIVAKGGNSFLQTFGKTTLDPKWKDHPILDYVLINPNVWPSDKKPKMDPYQWSLSNAQGFPIVSPESEYKGALTDNVVDGPVIEPPPPVVVIPPVVPPPPPAAKVTMVYPDRIQVSMTAKNGPILANLFWSDGSPVVQVVKDEVNTYIDLVNDPKTGVRGSIQHKSGRKLTLKNTK